MVILFSFELDDCDIGNLTQVLIRDQFCDFCLKPLRKLIGYFILVFLFARKNSNKKNNACNNEKSFHG